MKTQVKIVKVPGAPGNFVIHSWHYLYVWWDGSFRCLEPGEFTESTVAYFRNAAHAALFAHGHGWEVVNSFKRQLKVSLWDKDGDRLIVNRSDLLPMLANDVELDVQLPSKWGLIG